MARDWELGELRGVRFACLDGCGFCCTFTPEVATDELARLRARFPRLPVVREESGRTRLAFQGGCGACTLLSARRCTAYDDRPAHCRYFPFHVHFGPEPEVLVNRSCRGVEPDPAGDLGAAFREQVVAVAPPGSFERHVAEARDVHAEFESNARAAGAWGDARAAGAQALAHGPRLLTPSGLAAAAGGPAAVAALVDQAWDAFTADDPVARPFHLTADLRWLSFRLDEAAGASTGGSAGGGSVAVQEMQEDGSLRDVARLPRPAGMPQLPAGTAAGLHHELARLVGRGVFAGQAHAAVDDLDYAVPVEAAAQARVLALAAELAVRAELLRGLGVVPGALAAEAGRFIDSAFLDAPTIGGWL